MPNDGSTKGGGKYAGAPSLRYQSGFRPPLVSLVMERTAKPRLWEDCPMPATGPKLRVAAPRIVVLVLSANAKENRGSYPPYQLSIMLRRPMRPGPVPAKTVAPSSPPAPGFGV